jgi:hypothetical protein
MKFRSIAGVNVSTAGTYPWTVDVPRSELAATDKWVFRFLPLGTATYVINHRSPELWLLRIRILPHRR